MGKKGKKCAACVMIPMKTGDKFTIEVEKTEDRVIYRIGKKSFESPIPKSLEARIAVKKVGDYILQVAVKEVGGGKSDEESKCMSITQKKRGLNRSMKKRTRNDGSGK